MKMKPQGERIYAYICDCTSASVCLCVRYVLCVCFAFSCADTHTHTQKAQHTAAARTRNCITASCETHKRTASDAADDCGGVGGVLCGGRRRRRCSHSSPHKECAYYDGMPSCGVCADACLCQAHTYDRASIIDAMIAIFALYFRCWATHAHTHARVHLHRGFVATSTRREDETAKRFE